ncbi:hypothetical protein AB0912_10420 [Streptomyces sp. NPDC007084]|uniref:hypothetical protein n=1 Tax=Streptomyces sp. NPDC007084 TaxID=3154313 RepID=UPI0034534119
MANDSTASSARKRLTRKTPPKQPDPPEVALARSLLTTEYAVRGLRPGSGTRSGRGESAWDRLADDLARFIDRLRGRSPSGGSAVGTGGGSQETAGAGQSEPYPAPGMRAAAPQTPSDRSMLSSRAAFEGTIAQLPPAAREAFEDAVLHLVRTEKKWKKAYDKSPADMPSVAMYANNAYLRELRRDAPPSTEPATRERSTSRAVPPATVTAEEAMTSAQHAIMARDQEQFAQLRARWERLAPAAENSVTSSPRSSFEAPRADDMTDGHGFREAERLSLAERTTSATVIPRESDTFGAHGFPTTESTDRASLLGDHAFSTVSGLEPSAPPTPTTPTPVLPALLNEPAPVSPLLNEPAPVSPLLDQAQLATSVTDQAQLVSPLPEHAHLVSPLQTHATPVSPFPSEATPVSPLASPATPVSPPSSPAVVPSLLSGAGRQALRDSLDAFPVASGSRGADSSTRAAATAPAPVRNASNASNSSNASTVRRK